MPAIVVNDRWFPPFNNESEMAPLFSLFSASDPEGFASELRQAFAFLRRHGNGRYSPASLMKLLQAADRIEEALEGGYNVLQSDLPQVAMATVPYAYDEDTEVKTGGVVACGVVLPDGRMLLAVNTHARRQKVGVAMFSFITHYAWNNPVLWIHQRNREGGMFALSLGMEPREITSRGAVAYSLSSSRNDEEIATAYTEDFEYDEAMGHTSRGRARRRSVPVETFDPRPQTSESAAAQARLNRYIERGSVDVNWPSEWDSDYSEDSIAECGDPLCEQCRPQPTHNLNVTQGRSTF